MATTELGTCLSCGPNKRIYTRQLCKRCYGRAWLQGNHTNYPACGAVPVPYRKGETCLHPIALPPIVNLSTLIPRIRLPWGATQVPEWQQTERYNERRAAEWLAAREQQAA